MGSLLVKDLGLNATDLIVDGEVVQLIEIDEDTYIEGCRGRLDIINALATYILQNGVNIRQKMSEENMEEWGVTGNCYLIEGSLRKLSMYHKYARILVIFDLVVENKKIVLKRVENGE